MPKPDGPQFHSEDDEGPYCPECATDMGETFEAMDYWQNERPRIHPKDRLACKGCGVR